MKIDRLLADRLLVKLDPESTEKTIIATGSRPVRPGFLPWDDKRVMTSYEIFDWTEKPDSVMILGAGIIGCEFVSLYANLGIDVTVVEMVDRVLPTMAPEVGKEMTKAFKKAGVKVLTGKKLEGIDTSGDKPQMLYVPTGFAHGYQCLTDDVRVFYQMSEFYHPGLYRGLRWNDPARGIDWPLAPTVMSEQDRGMPTLAELLPTL